MLASVRKARACVARLANTRRSSYLFFRRGYAINVLRCGERFREPRTALVFVSRVPVGAATNLRSPADRCTHSRFLVTLHDGPDLLHLQDKAAQDWLATDGSWVLEHFNFCAGPIHMHSLAHRSCHERLLD